MADAAEQFCFENLSVSQFAQQVLQSFNFSDRIGCPFVGFTHRFKDIPELFRGQASAVGGVMRFEVVNPGKVVG